MWGIMEELYNRLIKHNQKVENAKTYNFFETARILKSEVVICRFLADLLNPKGNHKLGSVGLRLFMEEVFCEKSNQEPKEVYSEEYYQNFTVITEYVMENRRRIDIVIEGNERFIPIEVKIDAKDQDNQCRDYLEYAREIDQNAKIIYLTKYGNEPSDLSRGSYDDGEYLDEDDFICISFSKTIISWINRIMNETGKDLDGLLRQYVQAIERECGVMEQEERKMLTNYILENEEQLFTTWKLTQAMENARCQLMYCFFEELEQAMDVFLSKPESKKYGLCKEENYDYYVYQNQIDFEAGEINVDPGLNYWFKNLELKKKRQVWFRIEYSLDENALYAGLLVIDPEIDSNENEFLVTNDITRVIREVQNKMMLKNIDYESIYWIWQYLPTGTREYSEKIPDLVEMNQAAIALVNPKKRKVVIEQSIEVIQEMLDEIIEGGEE